MEIVLDSSAWIFTANKTPEPETPVLACVHGMDSPVVLEMRWESCDPFQEGYFKDFLYWDDPSNDGQDYEDRVFAWMTIPDMPDCN
jgi:hypothetical protein